jgi:hypothetical protein
MHPLGSQEVQEINNKREFRNWINTQKLNNIPWNGQWVNEIKRENKALFWDKQKLKHNMWFSKSSMKRKVYNKCLHEKNEKISKDQSNNTILGNRKARTNKIPN